MTIRALSLDFGGTLAAERRSRSALYAGVAAAHGFERDEARVAAAMARVHARLPIAWDGAYRYDVPWFERFIDEVFHHELDVPLEAVRALRPDLFATFADPATFRCHTGAHALLDSARTRGLRTAVVSNWSPALPGLLAGLGLAGRFDAVLVSADERLEKPDPRLFQRMIDRLGVLPDEVLHVGDHPRNDLEGAREAGCRSVLLATSSHAPSGTMPDPRTPAGEPWTPVVRSLTDVLPLLAAPPNAGPPSPPRP